MVDSEQNFLIGMPVQEKKPEWVSSIESPEKVLNRLANHGCSTRDSEFSNYKICPTLSNLVDGKRVAVVGSSGHLIGSGDGQLIDSYDIVVRINQSPNFEEGHVRDYGKKTNILSDNLNASGWHRFNFHQEYVKKMDYVLAPQAWDSTPDTIQEGEKKLEQFGIPFQRIENGYFFNICREVGTCINTGFSTIITMLNYDVKELYITGISFFNMNFSGEESSILYNNAGGGDWSGSKQEGDKIYGSYSTSVSQDHIYIEEARKRMHHRLHDQDSQMKYFQKVVDFHGPKGLSVLTLDNYLNKYFVEK